MIKPSNRKTLSIKLLSLTVLFFSLSVHYLSGCGGGASFYTGKYSPQPQRVRTRPSKTRCNKTNRCKKMASLDQKKPARPRSDLMAEPAPEPTVLKQLNTGVYYHFDDTESIREEDTKTQLNQEAYAHIEENDFYSSKDEPLSTFSIDVDTASYSNLRRFLKANQKPPIDSIRIEEMINYFTYDYTPPVHTYDHPFQVTSEISSAPWNPEHALLHIGIKGKEVNMKQAPASNLVFLIDVSGSMNSPVKLPLLKQSLRLLVTQLRPEDHVSIVTYSGAARVLLHPTSGEEREEILDAISSLTSGGSTAGASGIRMAYNAARSAFVQDGINRVILCTDGDFNVGISSESELVRLMEKERESDIFLSILGFGVGNYQDQRMSAIAQKGNGNYAYIDSLLEAQKVLVSEMAGTLFTIAKDVKIQVEFNPAKVAQYRLIGYENRALDDKDFNDDKKDAGELGSGHSVTALYELIPVGVKSKFSPSIDRLKYQIRATSDSAKVSSEWLTVKLRYKYPQEDQSQLISHVVRGEPQEIHETSNNFRFSAAVASFGQLLRHSKYRGQTTWDMIYQLASSAQGDDEQGYRLEFLELVKRAQSVH